MVSKDQIYVSNCLNKEQKVYLQSSIGQDTALVNTWTNW